MGHKRFGVISITDIHDRWAKDALKGAVKGAYVRCRVLQSPLGIDVKSSTKDAPEKSSGQSHAPSAPSAEVLHLSARPSHGGLFAGVQQLASSASATATPSGKPSRKRPATYSDLDLAPELVILEDLAVGSKVKGYVKAVGTNGLFVALDRVHDGRIRLRNLSDG